MFLLMGGLHLVAAVLLLSLARRPVVVPTAYNFSTDACKARDWR
jgi:hypothetical protein